MKYKMITSDRVKFDLTEEERNAVNKALVAGQKFVIIQGCTISFCKAVFLRSQAARSRSQSMFQTEVWSGLTNR